MYRVCAFGAARSTEKKRKRQNTREGETYRLGFNFVLNSVDLFVNFLHAAISRYGALPVKSIQSLNTMETKNVLK